MNLRTWTWRDWAFLIWALGHGLMLWPSAFLFACTGFADAPYEYQTCDFGYYIMLYPLILSSLGLVVFTAILGRRRIIWWLVALVPLATVLAMRTHLESKYPPSMKHCGLSSPALATSPPPPAGVVLSPTT